MNKTFRHAGTKYMAASSPRYVATIPSCRHSARFLTSQGGADAATCEELPTNQGLPPVGIDANLSGCVRNYAPAGSLGRGSGRGEAFVELPAARIRRRWRPFDAKRHGRLRAPVPPATLPVIERRGTFVSAITATLTTLPFTQLRRNRYFYLYYDGFYVVLCLMLIALMLAVGHQGLIAEWSHRYWLLMPAVLYAQILCSVFIHNATHNNFPRTLNRVVGELCGIVVLTRFASWEVIHQRHHRFSDDLEKDPHPVVSSYWSFVVKTIVGVEQQLQKIYFDLYGDTPENRRYERIRAYVSYATNILLIVTWYLFLGPWAFFVFFVPASIIGALHLFHFNWSTHNAFSPDHDFRPVNLNHGLYKLGNYLFFGIYMHANHHKRAGLFNPAKMKDSLPIEPPPVR